MDASIIIPARDRREMLLALLVSIRYATPPEAAVEIVVVDDGSADGTTDAVRDRFPAVRLIVLDVAGGPSAARNCGARAATGELLLFLDADGEVEESWLAALLAEAAPGTILLGNVADYYRKRIQSVPRRATFIGKSLRCRPRRANTGPSCNLGVPRAVFDALGGFDEELPYYFEDSDLCIRARAAGYRFRFVPGAVFRHHGSEHKTGEAVYLQERNSTYAMLKHYEDSASRIVAFALTNAAWMALRYLLWNVRGRSEDATLLARGWRDGTIRFLRPRV